MHLFSFPRKKLANIALEKKKWLEIGWVKFDILNTERDQNRWITERAGRLRHIGSDAPRFLFMGFRSCKGRASRRIVYSSEPFYCRLVGTGVDTPQLRARRDLNEQLVWDRASSFHHVRMRRTNGQRMVWEWPPPRTWKKARGWFSCARV